MLSRQAAKGAGFKLKGDNKMSDQQTKNPSTNEADQARAYYVSFTEWDVWGITLDALKEDEAIEIANQSLYGLAGMVWTSNLNTAHRVARDVKTGTMWVNCFFERDLRAPFGGYKESGMGREGGDYSYEFFTESKAVVMKFER